MYQTWPTALNTYMTTANDTNKTTAERPLDGALDVRRRKLPFEDDFGREDDEVLLLGILHSQVLAFQSADDGHVEPAHHVLWGGLARFRCYGLKLTVFVNTGHGEITDLGLEPDRLGRGPTHTHAARKQAHTTNHKRSEYEAWKLVLEEESMGEGDREERDDEEDSNMRLFKPERWPTRS